MKTLILSIASIAMTLGLILTSPAYALTAVMKTSEGDITLKLFPEKAPKTVENFVGLATGKLKWTDPATHKEMKNKPLYNGTIFHRVIKGFMIQGGDPLGMGVGGPGYTFDDEIDQSLQFNKPGLLAMANAGKKPDGTGTNGSQFFITTSTPMHLNGHHTIFGEVTKGMNVVEKIGNVETGEQDKPKKPVVIKSIQIIK